MSKKVSVIVPVYKTEKYLEKCLESLVAQTLENIEILVVNDGSPDNSQEIISRYENKYPQIISLIKQNGGLSDARNYGIMSAKGEFIAFVDSDDFIERNMMELMYFHAKNNELDVVICDTYMDYPNHSYILKANLGYTRDNLKASIFAYPNAPSRMIRTELMKQHLFKKGTWYEDLDLMPTFAVFTNKIGFVDVALYHYLQRDESIMNQSKFNEKFYDIFTVLEDVWNVFSSNGCLEKYSLELEYLYIIQLQRSALLRFVGLNGSSKAIEMIDSCMNDRFPNWNKNPYLEKSSWKFRLICLLGRYHQYWLIQILKKLGKG